MYPPGDKPRLRKIKRIAKKLAKKLISNNVKAVALSEYLGGIEELKDEIYSNGIQILNGRILFNYLVYDAIEYIANIGARKIETMEISILANDSTDLVLENIKFLAQRVKSLNIITNSIQKFKNVEKFLYDELGILIKLSNNKNKGLARTDVIVNMDFSSDLISKYTIPNNRVIFNINGNIIIKSKKFNGINVNDYKIEMPPEYKLDGFDDETVYETIAVGYNKFNNVREIMAKDHIKITELIGNNGKISDEEIRNLQ